MKILHCITDLSPDGAQRTLLRLLAKLPQAGFECRVVSLMQGGHLLDQFRGCGVDVVQLGLKRALPGPAALMELRSAVREWRPDVIQGWMYHGNIAALAASSFAGSKIPVLWNIRRCLYEKSEDKGLTRMVIKLGSMLSSRADSIIYCVRIAAGQHEALGFDQSKRVVIPNGFDTKRFVPTTAFRESVRAELGLAPDARLVGIVGRYHRQKDYPTFLRAAALVLERFPYTHFVMAGRDVTMKTIEARRLVTELGIAGRVHMLGERQDVPSIVASLDLFVSSSRNEGFSNVVGEAMACGVPCVATDAGASRELLDGLCPVVDRKRPSALANEIGRMLVLSSEERQHIGALCRRRIEAQYTLETMVDSYASLYASFDKHSPLITAKAAA